MSRTVPPLLDLDWSVPLPGRVTFEDFIAWANRHDLRAEWVDGEIVVMSPSTPVHERIAGFIFRILCEFVEAHALGEVFTGILMHVPTHPTGRVPDVLFVATQHHHLIGPTHLSAPADLVVEVVSPDSIKRDREEKLAEYAAAGIREYWLIDPAVREAIFYQLQADGTSAPGPIDVDSVYRSIVLPGFWLNVDWLWRQPLPTLAEIRRLLAI